MYGRIKVPDSAFHTGSKLSLALAGLIICVREGWDILTFVFVNLTHLKKKNMQNLGISCSITSTIFVVSVTGSEE